MKNNAKLLMFLSLIGIFALNMAMTTPPKKVLFFGDSITQEALSNTGYISVLKQSLDTSKFNLLGAGVGGNKVYDLYLRLEEDVLSKKPDQVFIYIGINDVWHKLLSKTGTDYSKFLIFYQAIINKIKANGSQIVLCTPSVIGEKFDGSNEVDEDLDLFAKAIRNLAEKNNLPLCDLRKAFIDYEIKNNVENKEKNILTLDKVHLNEKGNQLVAQTMMPFIN